MNNHVEIKTNDTSGEITINGISVSDIVRKYTITHEAGKPPRNRGRACRGRDRQRRLYYPSSRAVEKYLSQSVERGKR